MTPRAGLAPARLLAGEDEVLEKRDVVVLPAGGARHHRKARTVFTVFAATDFVLRGKPQTGTVRALGKSHHRTADATHESVHDRAQQRTSFAPRRGSEREPGKDLGFRDRSARLLHENLWKFIQRARRSQLLVQTEHELVAAESRVQRCRPVTFVQVVPAERTIGRSHPGPRTILVLHRLDTTFEDAGGVFRRGRRGGPRRRPDLRLVVFPNRHHRFGCDAEEPRCEVARSPGVFAVDDGGRGGDTSRVDSARPRPSARAVFGVAEHAETPDEAGRLRSQRAGERVRLVEHQEIELRAGEQLDVLLPGQEQLELLDVGEQDTRLLPGRAHGLPGADFLARIDRLAAPFAPSTRKPGFVVGPRRP